MVELQAPTPEAFQHCYVAADLEAAVETLRSLYGVGPFYIIRENMVPTTQGGLAQIHLALAWVGKRQFEIVQPVAGQDEVYRDVLPVDGTGMVMHHLGVRLSSLDEFNATKAKCEERGYAIPLARSEGPIRMFYADARKDFGHYLEYLCFSDDDMLTLNGRIPRY